MPVEGLEHFTKDELIEELINRQTFVGVVIFHREDAKDGRMEPGEIVIAKSPPLARAGVEDLLQVGESRVAEMFREAEASISVEQLSFHADRPPLRVDEGGAVRVGKSRISLDLVVEQYENGITPEDMVRTYDTLVLAEVYAVIAYYLRHRDEVGVYLKRRADEAEALQGKIEAERPRVTREELLARRNPREKDHAPVSQ